MVDAVLQDVHARAMHKAEPARTDSIKVLRQADNTSPARLVSKTTAAHHATPNNTANFHEILDAELKSLDKPSNNKTLQQRYGLATNKPILEDKMSSSEEDGTNIAARAMEIAKEFEAFFLAELMGRIDSISFDKTGKPNLQSQMWHKEMLKDWFKGYEGDEAGGLAQQIAEEIISKHEAEIRATKEQDAAQSR